MARAYGSAGRHRHRPAARRRSSIRLEGHRHAAAVQARRGQRPYRAGLRTRPRALAAGNHARGGSSRTAQAFEALGFLRQSRPQWTRSTHRRRGARRVGFVLEAAFAARKRWVTRRSRPTTGQRTWRRTRRRSAFGVAQHDARRGDRDVATHSSPHSAMAMLIDSIVRAGSSRACSCLPFDVGAEPIGRPSSCSASVLVDRRARARSARASAQPLMAAVMLLLGSGAKPASSAASICGSACGSATRARSRSTRRPASATSAAPCSRSGRTGRPTGKLVNARGKAPDRSEGARAGRPLRRKAAAPRDRSRPARPARDIRNLTPGACP